MKRFILLIMTVAVNCHLAFTQSCLPEGITFSTQEQIDNFQTNYPGCTEIEGDVTIYGQNITNLNGLDVLISIGGFLKIGHYYGGNPVLTSLSGLESLTSIGGDISIYNNYSLTSMSGLESLSSIGGYLYISSNYSMTSLSGLESLTSIGGGLNIYGNYFLISLSGLDTITTIGDYLSIVDNDALASLSGLYNLTSIGGDLDIFNNYSLTSLSGLESLNSIGGYLDIYNNYSLTSLSGLESLSSSGGNLGIGGNNALTNLSGLDNLTSIGGGLQIHDNNSLTSLSRLNNVEAASITDLYIRNNTSLSTCEVQSICDYLAAPNGTVTIEYNAPGCNSQEEVEEACETVGVEEPIAGSSCLIFPNPANEHLSIQLSMEKPERVHISVLNVSGQQMAVVADEQTKAGEYQAEIDISSYPPGVYCCRLQAGNETIMEKIIKY